MKRFYFKYILLFCFILLLGKAQAQYYYLDRGLAEVHLGVAVPFFDFGSYRDLEVAHYANLGINAGAGISYFYSRFVAVEFDVNFNSNNVNTSKLADAYRRSDSINNISATVNSGSFTGFSGVGGLRFDLPVNDQFSFVFKMMAGLSGIHKPAATINLLTISGPERIVETTDTQIMFAFYSVAGGRVKITDNLDVNLMISYIGSKVNFDYTRNKVPVHVTDHLGVIMVNAGVGYSF
ncbi:MAG: hypothetical protein Q8O72_06275 [Bacteroidales bacterium]|nr:hypothetical protein [Bacteroidales bacterium]